MADVDSILAAIDGALLDCTVSDDAMRWTPDEPARVICDGGAGLQLTPVVQPSVYAGSFYWDWGVDDSYLARYCRRHVTEVGVEPSVQVAAIGHFVRAMLSVDADTETQIYTSRPDDTATLAAWDAVADACSPRPFRAPASHTLTLWPFEPDSPSDAGEWPMFTVSWEPDGDAIEVPDRWTDIDEWVRLGRLAPDLLPALADVAPQTAHDIITAASRPDGPPPPPLKIRDPLPPQRRGRVPGIGRFIRGV